MSDDEPEGYARSTTTVSSYNRGKSSGGSNPCCNVCFGFVLVFSGIYLLGWNERRTVCKGRALIDAEDTAVKGSCDEPATSYNNKLVFLSCPLKKEDMKLYDATAADSSNEGLSDVITGVRGLCFEQRMQVYQCAEQKTETCTQKDSNGHCKKARTDFRYELKYSSQFLDSRAYCRSATDNAFVEKAKHAKQNSCGLRENPTSESFPFQITASGARPDAVKMGNWTLNSEQVHELTQLCNHPVKPVRNAFGTFAQSASQPPTKMDKVTMTTRGSSTKLYSCSPDNEVVGCLTAEFFTTSPDAVSLLYKVTESGFSKYCAPHSWLCGEEKISHIQQGEVDFDDLFEMFHSTEKTYRWGLRLLGFVVIFAGLYMIFSPIEWLAHHVPFIGDCVGGVVGCVLQCIEFLIAAGISLVTIAIVWVVMRPMVGIPLLLLGLAFIAMGIFQGRKNSKKKDFEEMDAASEMAMRLVEP
eukprot:GEMP01028035.1.p1 GENE.GEMP01028035.1~~GEMP01028035.1.p1  ORF type:complete len:470 (+),score=79.39 GEMP01028035.1:59-1468(+)